MSKKIDKLTKEQEALIPVYLDRYLKIGTSTEPTNRDLAAAAVRSAYKYLYDHHMKTDPKTKAPNVECPEIIWADSPFKGARIAAELANGIKDPTREQVSDQASKASYGSFEAYWVSFYAFIGEQLPVNKDGLLDIVKDIIANCGVYWTFEDTVVLTDKPVKIEMVDGKLHSVTGRALEYKDGSGIFAYKGTRYSSLTEVKLASLMKEDDEA